MELSSHYVEKAEEIIEENPNVSVRYLAQQLRTSIGSTHSILTKKLSLYHFKVIICQKLQERNFERRVEFCEWFKEKLDEDPDFLGRFIMSDEVHFATVKRQL